MNDRDQFAMAALSGLCANPGGPFQACPASGWTMVNGTVEDVARDCYNLADAMLAERGETPSVETLPEPKPEPKFKEGDRVRLASHHDECVNIKNINLGAKGTVGMIFDKSAHVNFDGLRDIHHAWLKNLELVTEERPFQVGDVVAMDDKDLGGVLGMVSGIEEGKTYCQWVGDDDEYQVNSADLTLLMTAEEVDAKVKK